MKIRRVSLASIAQQRVLPSLVEIDKLELILGFQRNQSAITSTAHAEVQRRKFLTFFSKNMGSIFFEPETSKRKRLTVNV